MKILRCDKCGKPATRAYGGINLCELHYLRHNPERNFLEVMKRIQGLPPRKLKERLEILKELKKYVNLKDIDLFFLPEYWYRKLKKEGLFP